MRFVSDVGKLRVQIICKSVCVRAAFYGETLVFSILTEYHSRDISWTDHLFKTTVLFHFLHLKESRWWILKNQNSVAAIMIKIIIFC